MCDTCGWKGADGIARLLILESEPGGKYAWARDTIMGIGAWISEHHHVTEKQVQALVNIPNAVPDVDSDRRWRQANRPVYRGRRRP